jgi:hypothetical protein
VPVGGAQRQLADEPGGGAQQPNEPPVHTACLPCGDGRRHQVEYHQLKIARDVVEPAGHGHERDGQRRDASSRDASAFVAHVQNGWLWTSDRLHEWVVDGHFINGPAGRRYERK